MIIRFLNLLYRLVVRVLWSRIIVPISVRDLKRHCYITGRSGSGKSEIIKLMIYGLIKSSRRKYCIVLIDPHGDLAEQTSKLNVGKKQRVVYIDPSRKEGEPFRFNPFELNEKTEENINIMTQQLLSAFEEILKDSSLTLNMRTLLAPCISTLLRAETPSTILDLQRFMDDGNNLDLIKLGINSSNIQHGNFFKYGFRNAYYTVTKKSIYTKIQSLINHPAFASVVMSPHGNFDFENAIESRSIIIFKFSKGQIGKEVASTLGKLIIARLQGLVLRRAGIQEKRRTPIFTFVDECHNFLSMSIEEMLTESRKYGLHLILAQQVLGQGMSNNLREIVMSNTNVKVAGANSISTLSRISRETGASLEALLGLRIGEFYIKAGDRPVFRYKASKYLLDKRELIDWKDLFDSIFVYGFFNWRNRQYEDYKKRFRRSL